MKKKLFDSSSFLKKRAAGDESLIPKGSNKSSTGEIFLQRDVYADAYPAQGAQPLDTHEGFNYHYGRVNSKLEPIFLAEDNLKQILSPHGTLFALEFVVDAFADLKKYLQDAVSLGKLDLQGSAFMQFDAQLAWDTDAGIHSLYNKHMQEMYEEFLAIYIDSFRDQQIVDFDSFVKHFLSYASRKANGNPITRVAYLTSNNSHPRTSGLVIELWKGDFQDDYAKYTGFIRDRNFGVYRRACERHGFLVDKNAPWRILADITNPYMQEKMKNYGVSSIEEMFLRYYMKASHHEMESLRVRLWQMYDLFVKQRPDVTVVKFSDKTSVGYKPRKKITMDEVRERYDDSYWLRLLIYFRAMETKKTYDQRQFEEMVSIGTKYLNYVGMSRALKFVDDNFKHTESELPKNNKRITLTEEELCDTLYPRKKRTKVFTQATFNF